MHWFEHVSEMNLIHIGVHVVVISVPHYLNPTLSESCVIIAVMTSGCSSCIYIKNICSSRWISLWYSNGVTSTAYLDPVMMCIWSYYLWNFTVEDVRTPGVSFGRSGSIYFWNVWVDFLSGIFLILLFSSYNGSNSTFTGFWMVWSSCLVWNSSWSSWYSISFLFSIFGEALFLSPSPSTPVSLTSPSPMSWPLC